MAKALQFTPQSRRDPVLVRLFRETGYSYDAGVDWLLDKLRYSFAQQPVTAAPRHVTYRAGTLEQLAPVEAPAADEALVARPEA